MEHTTLTTVYLATNYKVDIQNSKASIKIDINQQDEIVNETPTEFDIKNYPELVTSLRQVWLRHMTQSLDEIRIKPESQFTVYIQRAHCENNICVDESFNLYEFRLIWTQLRKNTNVEYELWLDKTDDPLLNLSGLVHSCVYAFKEPK